MTEQRRTTIGIVTIAVVMFFVALATDIFWIGRLAAGKFPSTMDIDERVYNAFAAPDLVLSVLLYVGAYGLLRLRKLGFVVAFVALGMWLFDSLLVLGITGLSRISFIGLSLFFIISAGTHLWVKRDVFV